MLLSLLTVSKQWLCWYLQLKWYMHFRTAWPSQLTQRYVYVYKVTHFWMSVFRVSGFSVFVLKYLLPFLIVADWRRLGRKASFCPSNKICRADESGLRVSQLQSDARRSESPEREMHKGSNLRSNDGETVEFGKKRWDMAWDGQCLFCDFMFMSQGRR